MFSRGYYTIGQVRGAPIKVHWSAPLGAVAFTGFSFSPGLWAGFFLLVVLHELGHAALVRRYGYQVTAVRVHAFGGDCAFSGDVTRAEDAAIAWGGVLVQAVLWVAATVALLVAGWPSSPILAALAVTFTTVNARSMLFNLLPIPPLDGSRAWPLLPMLWESWQERREHRRMRRAPRDPKAWERGAEARAAERRRALEAVERAARAIEPEAEPAAMPAEVRAVLDRITAEVRSEQQAKREKTGRG
jgi:hypothetical protein